MSRDRDPAGRPRNARPRDALGRPLARGAAGTGQDGTRQDGTRQDGTRQDGEPRIPDDLVTGGAEAARLADRLLREGRPFHAHEVLEAAWKSGPAAERDLWQGLAQIAVGLTHARRGNARGAVALLRRGAQRAGAYQERAAAGSRGGQARPFGIDLAPVLAAATDLAARIEDGGLAGIPPAALAPGLLAGGR